MHKGTFQLDKDLMKGLILMTHSYCNKFHFSAVDHLLQPIFQRTVHIFLFFYSFFFFLKWKNITQNNNSNLQVWSNSVWHKVKITDLDQAVWMCKLIWLGLHWSYMWNPSSRNEKPPYAFETSLDQDQSAHPHSQVWVHTYRQKNALCQRAM